MRRAGCQHQLSFLFVYSFKRWVKVLCLPTDETLCAMAIWCWWKDNGSGTLCSKWLLTGASLQWLLLSESASIILVFCSRMRLIAPHKLVPLHSVFCSRGLGFPVSCCCRHVAEPTPLLWLALFLDFVDACEIVGTNCVDSVMSIALPSQPRNSWRHNWCSSSCMLDSTPLTTLPVYPGLEPAWGSVDYLPYSGIVDPNGLVLQLSAQLQLNCVFFVRLLHSDNADSVHSHKWADEKLQLLCLWM